MSFHGFSFFSLSSTYIRDQLKRGNSVRYLVPENVERYIYEKNLYGVGDE